LQTDPKNVHFEWIVTTAPKRTTGRTRAPFQIVLVQSKQSDAYLNVAFYSLGSFI